MDTLGYKGVDNLIRYKTICPALLQFESTFSTAYGHDRYYLLLSGKDEQLKQKLDSETLDIIYNFSKY